MDYLKRRLKEAGPARWEAIAAKAGVAKSLPRKIAYDKNRTNFGIAKLQPLLDYFHDVDTGKRHLPWDGTERRKTARAD